VTGATGHLGANLVRQLLARGRSLRVLSRRPDALSLQGLDVERVVGDVRQPETLRPFLDGVEQLYHLAAVISIVAPMNDLVHAVNVEGTRNVARAALQTGVRRMVHACSVHAFEQRPLDVPIDERRARVVPGSAPAYDVSKAAGEIAVREAVEQGLDAVIVHPSGIIGPYDFAPSRMGQVFLDLFHRRLPSTIDGGFDWVDARDVARGTIAAMERGRTNESYLLTGHYASVADLGRIAQSITGVRPPRWESPMWLARLGAPIMESWARLRGGEPLYTAESLLALRANKVYLRDKAGRELGHAPRPIEDSVRDVYAGFAALGRLDGVRDSLRPEAYGDIAVS
jgi:dihydroflavonol-4-reductase